MKRGFMLTLLSLVLFMILVQAAVQLRADRGKVSGWAQAMMDDRKLLYASDDIAEDVRYAFGVRIVRSGNTLTFYDTLPANYQVNRSLRGYSEFVNNYYKTAELAVQFYDDAGNPIELAEMPLELVVYPYNLTYHYLDFGKRELEVYCAPTGSCLGSNVTWVGFAYEFQNANFTWIPAPGNESAYNWAPNALEGGCEGDPHCINFSLNITDQQGYTFTCPGPICNYSQFPSDQKSDMHIEMIPCWFQIKLGDDNIALLRLHEPNNPDVPCNSTVDAITAINFSSTDYYLNLPGAVRVNDTNYNFSRFYELPGENISGRGVVEVLPPANDTEASCFVGDGGGAWVGGSGNKYVYGIRVSNTCPAQNITIKKMAVSWVPDGSERLELININGAIAWWYSGVGTPTGRQPSGTTFDIVDFGLPQSTTVNITYLRFQQMISGKDITVDFEFMDNSTASLSAGT